MLHAHHALGLILAVYSVMAAGALFIAAKLCKAADDALAPVLKPAETAVPVTPPANPEA